MICDKDCENCRFEDCINDEMDADDYEESVQRDKLCMDTQQRKIKEKNRSKYLKRREQQRAYSRAYYRAHKQEAVEYHKKYIAENRERINAQRKKYNAANRDRIREQRKKYEKRNRGQYGQKQRILRAERLALGLMQKEAAKIIGVTPSALSQWERGIVPCNIGAIIEKLRSAQGQDMQV